jgi:hypothetical protein
LDQPARREHAQAKVWREQAELHLRQVHDLMFENARLLVMLRAVMPALFDLDGQPRCVSCGITLPPRSKRYCSQRCNQRAWRARKRWSSQAP